MQDYYFNLDAKSTNVRHKNIRQSATASLLNLLWTVMPGMTRWLVLRLFFSPRPYRTNVEEKAMIGQGRPFRFKVHEKTIQGWRWGEGPEVLLVHGWNGRGIQFHRFIKPLIASGYTAVAIDGPAHGASTGKITSYFEFTDTLRKILTEKRVFNVHGVIAHSFGAAALINALAKEKMAVRAVCIAPVLRLQELLFRVFDHFGIPQQLYLSLVHEFEARYGYHLAQDNPHQLMKELSGPILVVHDVRDRTAPYQDSAHQARELDHIALWSTKGLGHNRVLKDEEAIGRCVAHMASQHTTASKNESAQKESP